MVQTSFDNRTPAQKEEDREKVEADLFGSERGEAVVPYRPGPLAKIGEVAGDVSQKDIYLPRLQIIQSVGPLSRLFKAGDIVLSKEVCLAHEGSELVLIVLSVDKYFQERFAKFDMNGPRPALFATEKEVLEAGLKTEWGADGEPPTAEPVADIKMLIQKPESLENPVFAIQLGNKFWCAAVWTVQRTSYSRAAKRIFSARTIELSAQGLLSGLWTLSTRETTIKGNLVKAPVLSLVGRNSEALMTEITTLFGGSR